MEAYIKGSDLLNPLKKAKKLRFIKAKLRRTRRLLVGLARPEGFPTPGTVRNAVPHYYAHWARSVKT